jgi:hypothetical protein
MLPSARGAYLVSLTLLLASCSDDGDADPDGSDGASGASGVGGTMQPGGGVVGAEAGNAGVAGAAHIECATGASIEASFGPEGGLVEWCGARVEMLVGMLTEPAAVTLTIVDLPAAPPFPLTAAGAAFDVQVSGGVAAAGTTAPLTILVPHEPTTRYLWFYRHDPKDGWQQIEACRSDESVIGQTVFTDGIFVALADTDDFPHSTSGLGSGRIDVTFQNTPSSFDLDARNISTFAIYDASASGERAVTLSATQPLSASHLERLLVKLHIGSADKASLIEVTYGFTGDIDGLWSYLPFDTGPASITLTDRTGDHLAGSFDAELRRGDARSVLSGRFDVMVQKFRYPPELSCEFPEG